jgi:hypothetical protein
MRYKYEIQNILCYIKHISTPLSIYIINELKTTRRKIIHQSVEEEIKRK